MLCNWTGSNEGSCMPENTLRPFFNERINHFLRKFLQDDSVYLVTLIGQIISRDHDLDQAVDVCKRFRGGWSMDLTFW